MRYYGEDGLDKYIHRNFISKPFIDGTFLEIGALDGILYSNTKFFEDNMGFSKGILIEPEPDTFQKLVKNRPNCQCFNVAVHSALKKVTFLKSKFNAAINCIDNIATQNFKNKWHNQRSKKIILPATTMAAILEQSGIEYIDFFSLDVEGAEIECLKSMNWSIPVGLLCVEINQDFNDIQTILRENNFILMKEREQEGGVLNSIYFNKNYFRKNLFSL
jgi:FkbM family methyltransferase